MRYETRERYETNASGGQTVITESVPVYNRFEKMAMRRRDARERKRSGVGGELAGQAAGAAGKGILQFLIMNPYVTLALASILGAIIIHTVYSINSMLDKLVYQYTHLTDTSVVDSKAQFDKKLFYLKVNEDGSTSVVLGFSSDIAQEEMEQIVEESGGAGSSGRRLELSADSEAVKQALSVEYPQKAEAMAIAYELVNPTLGTDAAIGLMANIVHEGNYGVVEYSFSTDSGHYYKDHSFRLPSGGSIVSTKADLDYLKAQSWNLTAQHVLGYDDNGDPRYCKPESCGLGCVQWSFGRRLALIDKYYEVLGDNNTITDEMKQTAECLHMSVELTPGSTYYNTVSSHVTNGTVEEWAEAFCDYYVKPSGWCGSGNQMSNSGSACQARRAEATKIADILEGLSNE